MCPLQIIFGKIRFPDTVLYLQTTVSMWAVYLTTWFKPLLTYPQRVHVFILSGPSTQSCPSGSPLFAPQTVQVFGSVQVAAFHWCPFAFPLVVPHLAQVLGSVQVAGSHRCSGFPVVAPQTVHVFGAVQVAAFH